jgi:hypothetical protein
MKAWGKWLPVVLAAMLLAGCVETGGGPGGGGPGGVLGEVLKGVGGGSPSGSGESGGQPNENLTQEETVAGLKEALKVGSGNAVSTVSKTDGYWGNAAIRILLPEKIQKYEGALRTVGFGPKLDEFTTSMNRAAEKAAPYAKDLLWDAVRQITFTDAKNILFGADDAATQYFRSKTENRLTDLFKPVVHDAMAKVGVTQQYQSLFQQLNAVSLGQFGSLDLDSYVTGKALDGLFFMLAEEEQDIRTNPLARVSSILKKVFGSN